MKIKEEPCEFEIKEYFFKPFHDTYKRITFALSMGLMFPNPTTERFRIISIACVLSCCMPLYTIVLLDMGRCWLEGDIFNIIRHSTVVGPSMAAFFKIVKRQLIIITAIYWILYYYFVFTMILMYYKRVQAKEIIDEMNRDHECYNTLPRDQQKIAYTAIKKSILYTERLWTPIVTTTILTFPGMAVVLTIYSQLFDEEPARYMVHDVILPLSEQEKTFMSPFYECLNVNMFISALVSVFNYVSYDGFFALAANHACLKMIMLCKKLEESFKLTDSGDMFDGVVEFVEEQKRLFRFVYLIQDTFNVWLGTIFASTMIELGSLLYHISAGYGFDFKYTVFSITAVVHIFLPCNYAANVKSMSEKTATMIYCSGWENAHQKRIRRIIPFLIARAQIPSPITVLYIMDFDMELFVFLMRTSYSMFTLLRS